MMKKRAMSAALAAGTAVLAMMMSTGTAHAEDIPGFVNKVKIGSGTRTVYTGHTELDQTELKGCLDNAWIQGHATWTLGNVTATSIVVKSIQVYYRAGVTSYVGEQYLLRGNNKSVWAKAASGDVPGDTHDRSETYAINKTVPLDGKSSITFWSYFSLGRTGGPADCGGISTFTYKLQPVR
ncbi:hypothetical protein CF54_19700 [Streptomyces sp. Tu 6176]|uniref:hypothetical protein n=1 Tax=Streptomyces sp. Tu 6176 TaxID=1470557 RepID=UPI000449180F|nr:hypothetical protein [Streptomyces sp. Tu 6176]EYT81410.1 hypothetical protein CF54_19700 [Streptomyces sp. Tu 6176]